MLHWDEAQIELPIPKNMIIPMFGSLGTVWNPHYQWIFILLAGQRTTIPFCYKIILANQKLP